MPRRADQITIGKIIPTSGDSKQANGPLRFDRELLKEGHIHIRGRTRSGKTSLAIAPLIQQLICDYQCHDSEQPDTPNPEPSRDPIFVFDLGGDLALFNYVQELAEEHGRTFRFLSLNRDEAWSHFDPFQLLTAGKDPRIIQICNFLIQSFHLDYGLIYGGSYYTQRNLSALLRVARRIVQQKGNSQTVGLKTVSDFLESTKQRDEEEIRFTFQFLLQYEQLQPPFNSAHSIDMTRAIDDAEVIYFFCPTLGEATTARQIAGLGLFTVINAAMQRVRQGKPPRHCWVVADEFQELAGRSFAALLAQSSKFGISLIMANQTTTQLITRDLNLADIVRDNTLFKIYFTVTGRQDIEDLQAFCKDKPRYLTRSSQTGAHYTSGFSETIVPMLDKDTILETSSTSRHCLAIVDDGNGHHEPYRLETEYRICPDKYRRFKNTPPPPRNASDFHPAPDAATSKKKPIAKRSTERHAVLQELFDRKCRQENPEHVARQFGTAHVQ